MNVRRYVNGKETKAIKGMLVSHDSVKKAIASAKGRLNPGDK